MVLVGLVWPTNSPNLTFSYSFFMKFSQFMGLHSRHSNTFSPALKGKSEGKFHKLSVVNWLTCSTTKSSVLMNAVKKYLCIKCNLQMKISSKLVFQYWLSWISYASNSCTIFFQNFFQWFLKTRWLFAVCFIFNFSLLINQMN